MRARPSGCATRFAIPEGVRMGEVVVLHRYAERRSTRWYDSTLAPHACTALFLFMLASCVGIVPRHTESAPTRLRARRRRALRCHRSRLASCVGIGPSFAGGRTLRATPVTEG